MKIRCLLPIALLSSACGLKEAPAQLSDLCAFLYTHHPDEDPGYMEAGFANLERWLSRRWDPEETRFDEIEPLDDDVVDTLDDENRSVEKLIGMAVVTRSPHLVDEAAHAMLAVDEDVVYPDMFTAYERTSTRDLECFLAHECDRCETQEHIESQFALGLTTKSDSYNQYLWVETEHGPAFIQRNWLLEPPETNSSLLDVDEQYYMNLFLPRWSSKKGKVTGFYRLQATWLVVAQDAIPDDTAKSLTSSSMEDNSTVLDAWLDAHCERGSCE